MTKKRILANDGLASDGVKALEAAGFEVVTQKVEQDDLASAMVNYDALIVRSATKVNEGVLKGLKPGTFVVRAGVGIDNIDTKNADLLGVKYSNTPNSSSLSVAELAIAHIMTLARNLHLSNRNMGTCADADTFKKLKKDYEKGTEVRGKVLGIIGMGRIGQELAKLGLGLGMKVICNNRTKGDFKIVLDQIQVDNPPTITLTSMDLEEVLKEADYLSLHVPGSSGSYLIGEEQLAMMKPTAYIVNTARGGVIDEKAMAKAIEGKIIAGAALDVFEGEPVVSETVRNVSKISLTPHIGASTVEAQDRVSLEVAQLLIKTLSN